MDPRYMDFGEVDSSEVNPITQKEVLNKSRAKFIWVDQYFRYRQELGWGEGGERV